MDQNLSQSVILLEQNIKDSLTHMDRELGQQTDPSVQRVHKNYPNHWDEQEYEQKYEEEYDTRSGAHFRDYNERPRGQNYAQRANHRDTDKYN